MARIQQITVQRYNNVRSLGDGSVVSEPGNAYVTVDMNDGQRLTVDHEVDARQLRAALDLAFLK